MHIKYQKAQLWQCVSKCQGFTVGGNYIIQVADTIGKEGIVLDNDGKLRNLKQHQMLFKLYKEAPILESIAEEYEMTIDRQNKRVHWRINAGYFDYKIEDDDNEQSIKSMIIGAMLLLDMYND